MQGAKMIQWFDDHYYRVVTGTADDGTEIVDYLPSATTKLQAYPKPFLARWRGDVGNREADKRVRESGDRGTRCHYAASLLCNGGTILYNPFNRPTYTPEAIKEIITSQDREVFIVQDQEEMLHIWKFQRWMQVVRPRIIGVDLVVYSLKWRDAGTIDFVFDIDEGDYAVAGKPIHIPGGRYVVDLKTGSAIWEEYNLQVADYRECYNEGLEAEAKKIDGAIIIHTNATTKGGIKGLTTKVINGVQLELDFEDFRHVSAIWERENGHKKPDIFEFPSLLKLEE